MEFPSELKYSREHECVRMEGEVAIIGITSFAQDELGDIVYVETPKVGDVLNQNNTFGVVESVKTVSDLYAPLSGEVLEVNDEVVSSPELINQDAYTAWIIKVKVSDAAELDVLLSADGYKEMIGK